MNSKYIEETDPFILAYDNRIKYLFITDIHKEWYYNYPINYSFANDVYFQFAAKPYRYNLSGFIVGCTKNTITCIIDDNFDQLQLFPYISKYLVGNKYIFRYKIDGDYLTINDDDETIFEGVFIDKSTWESIFYFMKNRLMMNRVEQARFDDYLSKENLNKIIWPIHGNGNCDFLIK